VDSRLRGNDNVPKFPLHASTSSAQVRDTFAIGKGGGFIKPSNLS